jgi:cell fate regulator YaaT (PSP1 superfamily)
MYKDLLKGLPKLASKIKTKDGKTGRVISINPLMRSVVVETEEKNQIEVKF